MTDSDSKIYNYNYDDNKPGNGKASYLYEQVPTRAQFLKKEVPRSESLMQAGERQLQMKMALQTEDEFEARERWLQAMEIGAANQS